MSLQFSTTFRNAMLDQFESTVGVSAVLQIRTGSVPSNCAAASTGTLLATISLPSDWMNAASSGSKTLLGTWSTSAASNSGTAAHFRIFETTATTCHLQGTVGTSGTDMTVDSVSFTAGQTFQVTSFTLTAGNA